MLKALGIGKKKKPKPATDDQLKKYREQKMARDRWKEDLKHLQAISQKMGDEYKNHKGDFALGRYEQLKDMIKHAIKEFEESLKHHKDNENQALNEKVANRYGGGQRTNISNNLKDSAQGFAVEKDSTWEMSGKQVEEDTELFRKEVIQLKQSFRVEKTALEKLAADYQTSKKHAPSHRYSVLKQMIKDITRNPGQPS